ncbi:DUF262 domain-containing protein [Priestia megaterium]|uniref:DUF262 domain-containing protein n=1 Tax=Priestia megaterium TaxID=1404 RepID=UPI001AE0913D|nr:DUF1524 domain-containing protein [Priestia megaterium]
MSLLTANSIPLRNYLYLTSGTLKIPYSQRPYEWSKAQAERLFNDYYSVHESTGTTHVLNFITVYQEDDNNKYIYDGQQRTVSSLLIVASLIRILKELGDETSAQTFIGRYLASPDEFDDRMFTYKLIFEKSTANNIFKNYIVIGSEIPSTIYLTDYEKALKTNYDLFYELFKEKIGNSPSSQLIKNILKNILEKVVLILIETSDEDVAIKMFDTLNSTGQQLADFYVLKNYLVQILGEQVVKSIWENIESNTNGLNKNKFLVSYVSCFNGKTAEKNIFNKIKELKSLDDTNEAHTFLEELAKASKTFLHLSSPNLRANGTDVEKNIFLERVKALNTLKAIQYKPVIVAMDLVNMGLNEINSVLEAIITLQLRNIFIGEEPGNTLEQFYPNLAKSIYEEEIQGIHSILNSIHSQMINDTVLEDKFSSKIISTNNDKSIIKYVLRTIYNYEHRIRNQNELLINPDTNLITLEHILPEKPEIDSLWTTNFNDIDREKYTYLIGNLTLLLRGPNASASNNEFKIKVNEYATSSINQNQQIAALPIWEKQQIVNRTSTLFNTFKDLWPKI